ncbi:MAG: ATP-binding protein [Candidatus Omnitrophica bacterium]|nr:ATP-binding protein [Candidatus Omnitrophota bacterium]
MPERASFIEKLLTRLDRLGQQDIKNFLLTLADDDLAYQRILDELTEGIIITDVQGKIQLINRQAELWLGIGFHKGGRAFIQKSLPDESLARFVEENLKDPSTKVVRDFRLLFPRESHLRVFFIPIPTSKKVQVLLLLVNITEEKNREHDKSMMSKIETMIRLAAGLAHEIGNPLNSLTIHLELLKREIKSLPASKRQILSKNLNILNNETARLDKIVRNFLRATRKPPLRFRNENLNDLIEESIAVMQPEFENRGLSIDFKSDPEIPSFLMDRERLHQAFMNLIKNAMEAMTRGGTLRILLSHKGNVASIRFQDNGRGIEEKDLPHIFEPFYTTKAEGSGLGLMMVYDAIAEHGGRIEVSSKLKKETTFTLFLPIRRTELQLTHQKFDLNY